MFIYMANPIASATRYLLVLFFLAIGAAGNCQDSLYIKVLFLYGSRPAAKYRKTEHRWFGGKLGGHVGIEAGSNQVLNFVPHGRYHWFAHKTNMHSRFRLDTENDFWQILGGNDSDVKKVTVIIPVARNQRRLLDSLQNAYLNNTPYDYALLGMRCGASSYDILARLGIFKKYCRTKTFLKIFYPKKLRKRLLAKAQKNNWLIVRQEGTERRKWERD